mgnify:CR=1 FL=1
MSLAQNVWITVHETLDFESPTLIALSELWQSKLNGDALPSRQDFDFGELKDHLGWLVLVDVEREPLRFRYRLIGTNITELAGRDMTGRYFDELYEPDIAQSATASYRRIVETRWPTRVSASLHHASRGHLTFEAIDLPLSTGGDVVDMIMVRSVYDIDGR